MAQCQLLVCRVSGGGSGLGRVDNNKQKPKTICTQQQQMESMRNTGREICRETSKRRQHEETVGETVGKTVAEAARERSQGKQ